MTDLLHMASNKRWGLCPGKLNTVKHHESNLKIQTGATDFKADLDKKLENRRMCTIERIGVDNDDGKALYGDKCINLARAREGNFVRCLPTVVFL